MILENFRRHLARLIDPFNKFNQAFVGYTGGGFTSYDSDYPTYIEKGYQVNPLVYSIVNQMASKTASVPYYIKEIEDEQSKNRLNQLMLSTKGDMTMMQFLKYVRLQTKAYTKEDKPFPLEIPNPNQTWVEFFALYKTFLKCTGNVYIYMVAPEDGMNAGQPTYVYLLPSHLIQIVTEEKVTIDDSDPVRGYILTYGRHFLEFEKENVIHIKYSNPDYGENGEHLYGQSPLRAALRNIHSSNEALDLKIKTTRSGGAFGLIHGKTQSLTKEQADSIKDRLLEMDASDARLAKIAGVSVDVGFLKLSLSSDEMQLFQHLDFDEKQIADCLGWIQLSPETSDFGGTFKEIKKQRVIDNIEPDLKLLADALNNYFLPRFKGYENTCIVFDVMELPEMQTDVNEITEWLNNALDRGVIHRNEYREAIRYLASEDDIMNVYTVASDIISLQEAIDNDFTINGTTTN